ncbi:MAG: phosphoenolpyruvate carboxykinase (GTP) [Planctomycetota bacterium]
MAGHAGLSRWVDEIAALCRPDRIYWCDGSEAERDALTREALSSGELLPLDQEKLPGCVYHRTALNDVARTENLTYICMDRKEDAAPLNNWMTRKEGYERAGASFKGSMRGRTLYVVPFSMGPIGSPLAKIGVELTDSIYVVLNMRIMTRMGRAVLDALGSDGVFTRCLHGKADLDLKKRLILHFPEDNAIWSVSSGYGGNVLLGKKSLALRIASYLARQEGWLAEHMLILGIEDPEGKVTYVAAAFPSACGKTNLAMLIPPDALKAQGYKVWTVGDDIAWMRIGRDGRLYAINPEYGMFGVAPGTSRATNPNALATVQKNTIFTNVALLDDGTVWWEGHDDPPPASCLDWRGERWHPGMTDADGAPLPAANPNSRFTTPLSQCPSISPHWEDLQGVPISAFIFGGRRAHVAPLVYQSFNWRHGTFVGATMASERTAAQYGKLGEVRRDPMAMRPFTGYNMGDYLAHWIAMGERIPHPPEIFHVNWFRSDDRGRFLWPGFGENLRVLNWIVERSNGRGRAVETPIGFLPTASALDRDGLDLPDEAIEQLLTIAKEEWRAEADDIEGFFESLGPRLPQAMRQELAALRRRLG